MPIDNHMFGNLSQTQPLSETERKRLQQSMVTDWDRRTFDRIARIHQAAPLPNADDHGRPLSRESKAVWEFGNEINRRIEARELRRLAEQVQQRERQRHNREHTRQR